MCKDIFMSYILFLIVCYSDFKILLCLMFNFNCIKLDVFFIFLSLIFLLGICIVGYMF